MPSFNELDTLWDEPINRSQVEQLKAEPESFRVQDPDLTLEGYLIKTTCLRTKETLYWDGRSWTRRKSAAKPYSNPLSVVFTLCERFPENEIRIE